MIILACHDTRSGLRHVADVRCGLFSVTPMTDLCLYITHRRLRWWVCVNAAHGTGAHLLLIVFTWRSGLCRIDAWYNASSVNELSIIHLISPVCTLTLLIDTDHTHTHRKSCLYNYFFSKRTSPESLLNKDWFVFSTVRKRQWSTVSRCHVETLWWNLLAGTAINYTSARPPSQESWYTTVLRIYFTWK